MTKNLSFTNYINNITLDLPDKDKYYLFDFIAFEDNEKIFFDILKRLLTCDINEILLKNLVGIFKESIFIYIFKTRIDLQSKTEFDYQFNKLNLSITKLYKSIILDIKRK